MENTLLTDEILNGKWKTSINDSKGIGIVYCGGSRSFDLEQENSDFDICVIKTTHNESDIGIKLNSFEDGINAHAIIQSLEDIFGDSNSKIIGCSYKQWFLSLMNEKNIIWINKNYINLKEILLKTIPNMRQYTTTNFLLSIPQEEVDHLVQNAKIQLSYKKSYLYWIAATYLLSNIYTLTDSQKLLAQKIKVSHNAFLIDDMKLTDEEIESSKNTILTGIELAKTIDSPQNNLNNMYLENIKPIADVCYANDTRTL